MNYVLEDVRLSKIGQSQLDENIKYLEKTQGGEWRLLILRRSSSLLFLVFFLLLILMVSEFGLGNQDSKIAHRKIVASDYESHNPISISGNSEFNDLIISEDLEGDGSHLDPYIIDGLSITGSGSLISIRDTDVFFQISNCILKDGDIGIEFSSVSNGKIVDCTIEGNDQDGINFYGCNNIYIKNNDLTNNNWRGICTVESTNMTITKNILSDNSWYGIDLRYSPNNRILDNEFSNNGFILRALKDPAECEQTEVSGNTVNDKPLIYWQNEDDGTISTDAGQIVLYNCENIEVTDVTLTAGSAGITAVLCSGLNIHDNHITNNTAAGIYLWFSSDNTIKNNELQNNGLFLLGLEVDECVQDEVTGNTVNDKPLIYWENKEEETIPSGAGQIVLVDCDEIEIREQILERTVDGILVCFSSNININGNYIMDNLFSGIFVWFSKYVNVSTNLIANNKDSGIYFEDSSDLTIDGNTIKNNPFSGIYGGWSDDTTINRNIIENNLDQGIDLLDVTDGSITNNIIRDNELYGVKLGGCDDCQVEQNDFFDNNPDGDSQVFDEGYQEKNEFSHNYWSDWLGPDRDDDGIVDDPYLIDGDNNNKDEDPETTPNNPDLTEITFQSSKKSSVTPSWTFSILLTGMFVIIVFKRVNRKSI